MMNEALKQNWLCRFQNEDVVEEHHQAQIHWSARSLLLLALIVHMQINCWRVAYYWSP